MAKIRALKPEFFTDEKVVEVSPLARLLYQGMWVHSCDHGHLPDKPRQLKLRILPADDCSIGALIDELVDADLVQRHDGWLIIPTLAKHQKPDKRYFLTCNFPGCDDEKPVTKTRREEPADPEEVPPDPLSTLTARSGWRSAGLAPGAGRAAAWGSHSRGSKGRRARLGAARSGRSGTPLMAKIRALKPEFFTDEKVVEVSPLARLLYQGMWVHACDHGHLPDKPRQLKLRILPADDCSIGALIEELVGADLVQRHDGWLRGDARRAVDRLVRAQ